jgi:hypothetical protein
MYTLYSKLLKEKILFQSKSMRTEEIHLIATELNTIIFFKKQNLHLKSLRLALGEQKNLEEKYIRLIDTFSARDHCNCK